MRTFIYTGTCFSNGARDLGRATGIRRIRPRNSRYQPRDTDVIINWGSSKPLVGVRDEQYINPPHKVAVASNKKRALLAMALAGTRVPLSTDRKEIAQGWGTDVVVRHLLRGHSGAGIEIVKAGDELPDAPLYVQYVKKKDEYRVHILRGEVVDVQQKRVRSGSTGNNFQVRNVGNGWVFCREDVNPPEDVLDQSLRAMESLGLDFGAVDVIYNEHYSQAFVLEVNTAPGLSGTTLETYTKNIPKFLENV